MAKSKRPSISALKASKRARMRYGQGGSWSALLSIIQDDQDQSGISGKTPLGGTALTDFEKILRTNLTAAFFTVQTCLPYLSAGASIIFNGSIRSISGAPGSSAYAASKAGLRSITRVLATELSPRKIRVNIVIPGGTETPIWDKSASTPEAYAEIEKKYARQVLLERFGQAEEIAKAVLFLASDDASYVQATEIVVDGGQTGSPEGAPIYQTGL